jgi:hypothetical protein
VRLVGIDGARPYDLRHAFASLLIHEGRLSVVDIAAQLGHNPTVCLDTYAHVMAEQRGAESVTAEEQILQARPRLTAPEPPAVLEGQPWFAGLEDSSEADLMTLPPATDTSSMQELVPSKSEPGGGRTLNPNRVSIWPVERGGYGIDFTYHGATGYLNDRYRPPAATAAPMPAPPGERPPRGSTPRFRRG